MAITRGAGRIPPQPDLPGASFDDPNRRQVNLDPSASDAQIVAELGRRALTEADVSAVLLDVVNIVSQRLGTELVDVLEMVPGGEGFLMTAGIGWREGYVGQVVVPLIADSQAGFIVAHDGPVVVDDLAHEKRFPAMPLLVEHKAVSGASVVLRGRASVHGILSVHSCRKRKFAARDIEFLESVANVVAAALDRRETEEELSDANERLRLAMDAGRMGTWEWNVKSNEVEWSESLEKIHGLEPGSFAGNFESYASDIHEEDRERVFETIQRSMATGSHEIEYRIVRPDGEVRWLSARGVLLNDSRGEPQRMIGVCSDVTEQHIAEEAVRLAEEKYKTLFENAAFGVFQTTRDGRFITANDSLARILGYASVSELIETVEDIGRQVHVDPRRRAKFAELLEEQDVVRGFESLARRHDTGELIWISISARARRDYEGRLLNFEGVVEDVTERKRGEQRLAAQYAVTSILSQAPTVAEAMPRIVSSICDSLDWAVGGVWIVDRASDVLRCLNIAPAKDFSAPRFQEISQGMTLERGVGLSGRVWASGQPAWIEDVTVDPNFPRAEPAKHDGLRSAFAFPITVEGETIGVMEFFTPELQHPDSALLEAMQAVGGHVGQYVERKRAEDERDALITQLESAEARYRSLFEGVEDTILVTDENERYIDANPAALDLLGYSRDELLAMGVDDIVATEADWRQGQHELFMATGTWQGEIELRRKDGSVVPVDLRANRVDLPMGSVFVAVARDATERKAAERELQTLVVQLELSRQRVNNLVSNVPGVVWEAWGEPDASNQRIDFVSEYVESMLGYTVEEWLSTPNFWLSIVHPDDREQAGKEAAAIYAGRGGPNSSEFRWVAKDGRALWVEAQSTVIRDARGKPVGMRGVTMDITHRREAEAQLRESEERFSKAFHASPAGLSIVSADDRRFLDVNESFLAMTGYHREDIVGRPVDETGIWPSDVERTQLQEALVSGDGHAHNLETQICTASGEVRSVLGSAEVITLGGRPCILALTYDITDRKRAEERQVLLAEVGSILASSMNYEETLGSVARLLVGRVADVCSVDMVEGDSVRRVALAHSDPGVQRLLDTMEPVYTPAHGSKHPVVRVASDRKPELHADIDPEFLRGAARDEQHFQVLTKLGVSSAMVVPLVAGGRSLGAFTLAYSTSNRRYSPEDLQFAEEVARRAGVAIDNALRYAREEEARRRAELFAERTGKLQAVTAALSESLTSDEVGEVVIEAAMAIAKARSGVIAVIAPGGKSLRLIAAEGVTQGFRDTWDDFAANPPPGVLEAIASASPMFVDSRKDLLKAFPSLEKLSVVEGRSFGSVPLRVENSVMGSMVLTFEGTLPDEHDREFVLALGRQCAQALERARLFDAEQEARRLAEEATAVVSRLQSLTEAVLTHHSVDELLVELLRRVHTMLEVDTTNVLLLQEDGRTLKLRGSIGMREHVEEGFEVPFGRGIAGTIAASKKPLISHDLSAIEVVSPFLRGHVKSLMGVPLMIEGRVIGVLHVGTVKRRKFTDDEVRLLSLIADRLALSIDHIQLYEAEQRARTEAEAAEERHSFLAQASAILSSSLDYETTLSSLARLCVPYLGDWCAIDILTGDTLERVAVVHMDPAKVDLAYQLRNRYPPDMEEQNMRRLLAGESLIFNEVTDELLSSTARDAEHLAIMRGLSIRSLVAVPLRARGRILGTLVLARGESGRTYGEAEVSLAEDLGHRAGLAVDNARLYSESQVIQEELRVANEAKDEFLGLVSHELRTPITTIYGGARLMRSRGDNLDAETQRGVLEDIEHESERLHRIVEDLLVLARVELGQEVVTEPILVQRLAERTVTALSRRKAGRLIEVDAPADLPPVRASSVYLEQILRNLINNADKYSPAQEPIQVAARRDGNEVVISVADRGPGIPSDELDLIFERFYRSSGTAKHAGGAGIGLTVCKRLIEAQDGRIWAEARDGGGLKISFSLPVYEETEDQGAQ